MPAPLVPASALLLLFGPKVAQQGKGIRNEIISVAYCIIASVPSCYPRQQHHEQFLGNLVWERASSLTSFLRRVAFDKWVCSPATLPPFLASSSQHPKLSSHLPRAGHCAQDWTGVFHFNSPSRKSSRNGSSSSLFGREICMALEKEVARTRSPSKGVGQRFKARRCDG